MCFRFAMVNKSDGDGKSTNNARSIAWVCGRVIRNFFHM